jgi:energy-coupling factor transporter ATP-binding protein EcfA2
MYEIIVGRNEQERAKLGLAGTVLLGKHYVRMGETESLSNEVYLDVNHSHVVFICGKRGSGKSYTMGALAEGMAMLSPQTRQNISVVLLDTMGIYWTMKYPNKKDKALLQEWGFAGDGLDITIFTPEGFFQQYADQGIPTDHSFSVLASELTAADWCQAFDIPLTGALGSLIEKVVHTLRENRQTYGIEDILLELRRQPGVETQAAINRFENAKFWGLFSDNGTPLRELVKPGQITVLDVSCYAGQGGSWNVRSLVIGLVAQKLFIQRMQSRKDEEYAAVQKEVLFTRPADLEPQPLVWLMIDEAHEFLPRDGKTPASDSLITILREGRQPGISLVLATQQPGKIHTDVMTQSDVIISHRITAKLDTDALAALTQSYMRGDLDKFLNELPRVKGAAVVLDDNNEKIFPIRVRPRQTWHGGSDPELLSKEP